MQVTTCITTNFMVSAPDTDLVETCIDSLHKKFPTLEGNPIIISCDLSNCVGGMLSEPQYSIEEGVQYVANLLRLKDKYKNYTLLTNNQGLRCSTLSMVEQVKTPLLLFLEHDWEFTADIDFDKLIHIMTTDEDVRYIGFPRKQVDQKIPDTVLVEDPKYNKIPLTKSSRYSSNPHLAETDLWTDTYKNIILPVERTTWLGMEIETPITRFIENTIGSVGFDEAHKIFGSYVYGNYGTPAVVKHLDGKKGWNG